MPDEDIEHIEVSDELAELGCPGSFGDALVLASCADRKKIGEEGRAMGGAGFAYAACGMRGWRESMEDASLVMPPGYLGGNWRDAALFGVFDGHGGEQVARFAVRQVPQTLAELPTKDPELALTQAFRRVDELLAQPAAANELRELTIPGNMPQDSADNCGCTAVCCMVLGDKLVLSNTGDSRAVLCRDGQAALCTEDHKPDVPTERARIEASGGFIEEEVASIHGVGYRVNGNLNLSRALGDLRYKDPFSPPEKHIICGVPDTQSVTWQHGVDEFMIMACDGVWECMSSQQVVNFVRSRLPPPGAKRIGLQPVLEQLIDACCANHPMQRGGLGCDNISAVLIRFEDPAAVAAAAEDGGNPDEVKEAVSERETKRIEAMLSSTIQRLSDRRFMKKETPEDKAEREARLREELAELEAREKKELEQEERRKKRKQEREVLESKSKKKLRCCALVESDEEDGEWE